MTTTPHTTPSTRVRGLRAFGIALAALALTVPSIASADSDRRSSRHYSSNHHGSSHHSSKHYSSRHHGSKHYSSRHSGSRHYSSGYYGSQRHGSRYYDSRRYGSRSYGSRSYTPRHHGSSYRYDSRYRSGYSGHGHYGSSHRSFTIPRLISSALQAYSAYHYGKQYYAPHRHHHTIYRFPVYNSYGVSYKPYAYCEGQLYGSGYFGHDGKPYFD